MRRVGLVLSGGGAKGAYEIGVWKALKEMEATKCIDKIVGTSVGALNAVLLDACGIAKAEEIWINLKQDDLLHLGWEKYFFKDIDGKDSKNIIISEIIISAITTMFGAGFVSRRLVVQSVNYLLRSNMLMKVLANPNGYPFLTRTIACLLYFFLYYGPPIDQRKIRELIDSNIDFNLVKRDIYILASEFHFPLRYPRAFCLNNYLNDYVKCRNILLASSGLPIYCGMKGVEIGGDRYVDAGFLNIKSNTPISYARDDFGWERTITVWLNHKAERNEYSKTNVDIIPSDSLGDSLTIDRKKIERNMEMGQYDTMKRKDRIMSLLYY